MIGAKIFCRHFLCVAIVAALLIYGCTPEQPDYPKRQMPEGLMEDTAQLAAGHELFRDKCASCHGKPSEGRSIRAAFFQPPAPDFTEAHYQEIDPAYLFWRIEFGKTVEPYLSSGSVMPAWRGLTDREIWQLVAYLKARTE
jgi:mono/diheme cytochrome c family protein